MGLVLRRQRVLAVVHAGSRACVADWAVAAVFGFALVNWMSLNAAEVMIAFAPGSVDAMMLLALALHLDPVYVGAHHVTRIFLVSLSLPFMSRRLGPKMKAVTPPPPRDPPTFQD
jgi:uncharacterized membrane protein AbrB (regulator of aidB expression)